VTRAAATDDGARVRALSEEISQVRTRLTAVVTELDRRRHHATDVKHLAREHTSAVAAAALVLATLVATPVVVVWRRRRRQRRWPSQVVTLTDRASRLGRALGRAAHDPDRLAARPPMLGIPLKTVAALVLTMSQIVAETMRQRRRHTETAARHEDLRPGGHTVYQRGV
jgi:hypothetical protein